MSTKCGHVVRTCDSCGLEGEWHFLKSTFVMRSKPDGFVCQIGWRYSNEIFDQTLKIFLQGYFQMRLAFKSLGLN